MHNFHRGQRLEMRNGSGGISNRRMSVGSNAETQGRSAGSKAKLGLVVETAANGLVVTSVVPGGLTDMYGLESGECLRVATRQQGNVFFHERQ